MTKKIEKKEIAELVDVPVKTAYNWEKNRKKLFNVLEEYIKMKNENITNFKELKEYFEKLTEQEQEMYISEIKARVLRKELK